MRMRGWIAHQVLWQVALYNSLLGAAVRCHNLGYARYVVEHMKQLG